jgi:hypothetical protein
MLIKALHPSNPFGAIQNLDERQIANDLIEFRICNDRSLSRTIDCFAGVEAGAGIVVCMPRGVRW